MTSETPLPPDPLRDLLTRVAAGDLDPAEAARLLDEDPAAPTVDRDAASGLATSVSGSVAAVLIKAGGVKLTVVADPTVDTLVADGPHSLRHDGSTLVLESPREEGYQTQPPPRFLGWVPGVVWTAGRGEKVHVRVNPDLPLTVDATACGVEIIGTRSSLTLAGSASSVKVRDHVGSLHGSLSMGSLAVVGTVTGPSDLACELGSLDLRLDRGSDVTVTATVEMGSLRAAGEGKASTDGTTTRTIVAGAGTHPFGVLVRMGSASVGVAS
ncbi:MAG: hypothetical protein U0R68_14120 [Candidatus Nanopelagicales bacterium]